MRFSRFLLPLLALSFLAAASKPKLTIRFHTESHPSSGSSFSVSADLPDSASHVTISRVAEISENDVAAIFPFPAADGTMGCALKLDEHGRVVLDCLSQENRGALFIGFVNARPVIAMLIDRRVSDGIITIPRGLTPMEIAMMQKKFPTLGEKKAEKNAKAAPAVKAPAINVPTAKAPAAKSAQEIIVPPPLSPELGGQAPRGD